MTTRHISFSVSAVTVSSLRTAQQVTRLLKAPPQNPMLHHPGFCSCRLCLLSAWVLQCTGLRMSWPSICDTAVSKNSEWAGGESRTRDRWEAPTRAASHRIHSFQPTRRAVDGRHCSHPSRNRPTAVLVMFRERIP